MLSKIQSGLVALLFLIISSPSLVADDVLKSEFGAPLKVIVRNDSAVFAEPTESSRSQPLRQFEWFFVLPADESGAKTKKGHYRIATGKSLANEIGWVKADDVVEWEHRLVGGFTKRGRRGPAYFFENQAAVLSHLNEGGISEAISRESDGSEIFSLLPILKELKSTLDGEEIIVFEFAYLHTADPKNIFSSVHQKEAITLPQVQAEITLDIVFVIDTTSSMKPHIEAAKEVVRKIAAAVNANQHVRGRVRLGLVGYRDEGDEYVSKVLCSLESGSDLAVFEKVLANTVVAGGGDDPEQVYAGLRTAITDIAWNDVANRHIILIGDAPNHEGEKSLVAVDTVLAAAQPGASSDDVEALFRHITMHTLQVGSGSGPMSDLCRDQFSTIAAGRDFAGISATTDNTTSFIESLAETLTNRVRDTVSIVQGDVEEFAATKDPNKGAIGAILQYLGKEKLVGATFASGYSAEIDAEGNRTIEPFVLVGRNELKLFASALEFCVRTLEGAGDPGSKDVDKILQALRTLTVHISYDGEITADTPLKEILQLILGLPVKSRVFDMTPARLAAMSQKDFESWVAEIDASHAMVTGHIENARWFNLGKETRPQLRFAFVRLSDLP
ncbi:MAG: VWA domain-containing protein [Pirellulaceae bacterium]|nr:VWA domain-containing protein [Pirellulaceae bacterium]